MAPDSGTERSGRGESAHLVRWTLTWHHYMRSLSQAALHRLADSMCDQDACQEPVIHGDSSTVRAKVHVSTKHAIHFSVMAGRDDKECCCKAVALALG